MNINKKSWQYLKLSNAYFHAKERCEKTEHPRYLDWGGRGIKFEFKSIHEFYLAVGLPETKNCVLDRVDNSGNYQIGNVRWVSASISNLNKRIPKNNKSGVKGVSKRKNGDWSAQAWKDGKQVFLYQGKSFFDAVCARKSWEVSVGPNMKQLEEIKL